MRGREVEKTTEIMLVRASSSEYPSPLPAGSDRHALWIYLLNFIWLNIRPPYSSSLSVSASPSS